MSFAYTKPVAALLTAPMAGGGLFFIGDLFHGKVSKQFLEDFGYGSWFVPLVGAWKLGVAALCWYEGGIHRATAMQMLATLLGGVEYTHAVAEPMGTYVSPTAIGKSLPMLLMATYVLAGETDRDFRAAAVRQLALCAVGWGIGSMVARLSPSKPSTKA